MTVDAALIYPWGAQALDVRSETQSLLTNRIRPQSLDNLSVCTVADYE